MSKVVTMRKSVNSRPYLRLIESPKRTFNPFGIFIKLYERHQARKARIRKRKINALVEAAYDYYLDYYLTYTKGTLDIHEALYKSKLSLCKYAMDMAEKQVDKVIKEKRVDKCYMALLKMKRERTLKTGE